MGRKRVTNNPKIQETLDYLNKKEFELFRKEHRKEHTVLVGNGERKEMRLNIATGILFDRQEVMSEDITEIKSYTKVLKEGKTVKDIIKRHWKFLSALGVIIIPTLIKFWIG